MRLRPMELSDIDAGLRLCRAAGWNQLEPDWRCFLELNPGGSLLAECGGAVAGTVATLRYEQRFAWVSMVLVDPAMRRRGIGTLLLREALNLLADIPAARLDATPAGKQLYDGLGFVDEYRVNRLRALDPKADAAVEPAARPMADSDLPSVFAGDRKVFGADRSAVLLRLYRNAAAYAFVTESGYAFGRHGFRAEHIGPVVANDEAGARALVNACLARNPGLPFLIDAPAHSAAWRGWLEERGFAAERPFIRMFRGAHAWPGVPSRQFAIAGPELG